MKTWKIIGNLGISLALFLASSMGAVDADEQVKIADSIGYTVTVDENEKYGLFPEYENFVSAEVIRSDGQLFLETTTDRDGKRVKSRVLLSETELENYRTKIRQIDEKNLLLYEGISRKERKEGKLPIVSSALSYGLGLYGPGILMLTESDDGNIMVATELLIGVGFFVGSLVATRNHQLGYGRSKLLLAGAYAGTAYGFASLVFADSVNEKSAYLPAMLLTPIGGAIAYKLSDHRWFNKGETDLIVNGGIVGALYGASITHLLLGDDQDDSKRNNDRLYVSAMMVGAPLGVLGATKLIPDRQISQGRAHLITLGGIMGTAYALGLTAMTETENGRAYLSAAMLGLPIGAYLGHRWTAEQEYSIWRGRIISTGTYAGVLFGLAINVLVKPESLQVGIANTMIGTALGTWVTHKFTQEFEFGKKIEIIPASPVELLTFGITALGKSETKTNRSTRLLSVSF